MSEFQVLAPDDDPALTGYPVSVSKHKSADAAIEAAKKAAFGLKRLGSTVMVVEDGTNNAWSIQFHPEPPVQSGAVDELGIPQYAFEPEFRIVFDGTEVETEEDADGNRVSTDRMVGEKSAYDITADGEEVDREDLV